MRSTGRGRVLTPGFGTGRSVAHGSGSSSPCSLGQMWKRPRARCLDRLHRRPCPPQRRRCSQKGAHTGEPDDHAIGRCHGGLSTKVHLAADGQCRPLYFVLTPGQAGDAPAFEQIMAAIRIPRPLGRPRTRPEAVLADRAHSSRAVRHHLRHRGIRAVIPQPADQIANRKRRGRADGRPPGFDRQTCKRRNTVEHCINRLKQWPGLAHSLREDRHHLPRRPPHRGHLHPVRPLTRSVRGIRLISIAEPPLHAVDTGSPSVHGLLDRRLADRAADGDDDEAQLWWCFGYTPEVLDRTSELQERLGVERPVAGSLNTEVPALLRHLELPVIGDSQHITRSAPQHQAWTTC